MSDNKLIRDCKIGEHTKIMDFVNLYECEIGSNSFVGPFVEIQRDVRIGDHTRIQSHSFICSLVTIGDHCFIGHGVMFINDVHPPSGDSDNWKPTVVGDRVSIGSNATIMPVEIGEGAMVGAGAVVTKDVPPWTVVAGNPAVPIRKVDG